MFVISFSRARKILQPLMLGFCILILLSKMQEIGAAPMGHNGVQFNISPSFYPFSNNELPRSHFVYTMRPGDVVHDSLHIINSGTVRGTVNLHLEDAMTSQMSGETFPNEDVRRDVGAWIAMNTVHIALNPGQSVDVPFQVRVPLHVRPGDHAGGIVADEPETNASPSHGSFHTSIKIHVREIIGVLIHLPGPYIQRLEVNSILYGLLRGYQCIEIGIANSGTQFLHPSGSLSITDTSGQRIQNLPLKLDAILPQTMINYPVFVHHIVLNPGSYSATVRLKYEGNHILTSTSRFVVPLSQVTKSTSLPGSVVDLVQPNDNLFSILTPWHYVVAIGLLFFLFSALFFWSQKLYRSGLRWRQKYMNEEPADEEDA